MYLISISLSRYTYAITQIMIFISLSHCTNYDIYLFNSCYYTNILLHKYDIYLIHVISQLYYYAYAISLNSYFIKSLHICYYTNYDIYFITRVYYYTYMIFISLSHYTSILLHIY